MVNDKYIALLAVSDDKVKDLKVFTFRKTMFGNYSFLHALEGLFEEKPGNFDDFSIQTYIQLSNDTLHVFLPWGILYQYDFSHTTKTFNKTCKLAQIERDSSSDTVAIDDERLVIADEYSPQVTNVFKLSPKSKFEVFLKRARRYQNVKRIAIREDTVHMVAYRNILDYNTLFVYDLNTGSSPSPSSATSLKDTHSFLAFTSFIIVLNQLQNLLV